MEKICDHYKECGGCSLRDIDYPEQLEKKKSDIVNVFKQYNMSDILPVDFNIVPSEDVDYYRNKMEFTFSSNFVNAVDVSDVINNSQRDDISLGLHKKGQYNAVVNIKNCFMQTFDTNRILEIIKNWSEANNIPAYDKKMRSGILRYLIIRYSRSTEAFMINLVVTEKIEFSSLIEKITAAGVNLKSVYLSINRGLADSSFTEDSHFVWGEEYLEENIEGINYKIGPYSFFQINSSQIKTMYNIAKDWLGSGEVLVDLYCGVGGFGLYLAKYFKSVLGVDNNQEAINMANLNAKDNNINNCEFFCGKVEHVLNRGLLPYGTEFSMVVDPARSGIGKKALRNILQILPKKIVYTSCRVESFVRDFEILNSIYDITDFKALDMFPHTEHLEVMVCLQLKENPDLSFITSSKNKYSCLNMLKISEFNADQSGNILNANNAFYKFAGFIRGDEDVSSINIIDILKQDNIEFTNELNDIIYRNIKTIFAEDSGLLRLKINIEEKFVDYNFAFEKTTEGFKGIILKYCNPIENILDNSIFEKFFEDILVIDDTWTIEKANHNFFRSMNFAKDDVLGKKWNEIVNIRDFDIFLDQVEQNLRKKGIWEGEMILSNTDNKVMYYYCTILATQISGMTKYLVIKKDITDNVDLEKEFITKTNQSNRLIREIDKLISLIRNERNSPLFKIKDRLKEMDNVECIENINLLEKKINNLRNSWFFNVEFNDFNMDTYDVIELIKLQIDKFVDIVDDKELNIDFDYNFFVGSVYLDRELFLKMFYNIFDNATKFAPTGSTIYVKLYKKNGFLKIHVIDEGVGISPENHNKIFSKYVKIGDLKDKEGEGLGLCIVRDIVDLHNGSVWVESPPKDMNQGSDFIVQIPIEKRSHIR